MPARMRRRLAPCVVQVSLSVALEGYAGDTVPVELKLHGHPRLRTATEYMDEDSGFNVGCAGTEGTRATAR